MVSLLLNGCGLSLSLNRISYEVMVLQCRHILQICSTSDRYVMSPPWCKARTAWCADLSTSSEGSCKFIVNHIRRFAWTVYALADSQRPSTTTSFRCWDFLNYFWIFLDLISVIFLEYLRMGRAGFLPFSLSLPLFFNWLPLVLLGASFKSKYIVLMYFIPANSLLSLIISNSSPLIFILKRQIFAGTKKELFAPMKTIYT
jgi:hypothetical protein